MKLTQPFVPEIREVREATTRADRSVERRAGLTAHELAAVAALAHDLRSPLSAVLGFARLAREDLAAGDNARAALLIDRIERSASTLGAILRCALDESACPSTADLNGVLEQISTERKPELERRDIRLLTPEDPPALGVRHAELYRLVNNLVGNAIDHMGDTHNAVIAVSIACQGESATLCISDNGVGIAAERHEFVFDVARTNSLADGGHGHRGLGLAIVRQLAASWGGRAWVEPSPHPGAKLCVTLPLAR